MDRPDRTRRVREALKEGRAQLPVPQRRGHQLTERDVEIVRWTTRHGVVTAELVARRFFWRPRSKTFGIWAAYRRLKVLEKLGLIRRDKPFAHRPAILRVTGEGGRLADVGLRPAQLVLAELEHSLAIVTLAEYLLAEHGGAELVTERELRAQRYRERKAGGRQPGRGRIPDALLNIPTKGPGAQAVRTVAVEVDRSRRSRRSIEEVINAYDHERVDAIWWYVAPERAKHVRDIVRANKAQDRFEIRELPTWLA